MKLVVGLGNPGEKYKGTRHNVGFLVVDRLAARHFRERNGQAPGKDFKEFKSKGYSSLTLINSEGEEILLVKPQGFMNKSGVAVKGVFKKHPGKFEVTNLENLWVVHDDLDIALGEYKISRKGPKAHNGLKSIYEQIGTKEFWYVRVGVDNRGGIRPLNNEKQVKDRGYSPSTAINKMSGEDYVLSSFRPEERKVIDGVIDKIVKELKHVLA